MSPPYRKTKKTLTRYQKPTNIDGFIQKALLLDLFLKKKIRNIPHTNQV